MSALVRNPDSRTGAITFRKTSSASNETSEFGLPFKSPSACVKCDGIFKAKESNYFTVIIAGAFACLEGTVDGLVLSTISIKKYVALSSSSTVSTGVTSVVSLLAVVEEEWRRFAYWSFSCGSGTVVGSGTQDATGTTKQSKTRKFFLWEGKTKCVVNRSCLCKFKLIYKYVK
jgi:hypothetical protein